MKFSAFYCIDPMTCFLLFIAEVLEYIRLYIFSAVYPTNWCLENTPFLGDLLNKVNVVVKMSFDCSGIYPYT